MNQQPSWIAFNKSNIHRHVGSNPLSILAVRRDGRGYYGTVNQVTTEYVEICNGDNLQNLYFYGAPMVFAIIEQPPAPSYKMAQPRLKLEEKSNGRQPEQ